MQFEDDKSVCSQQSCPIDYMNKSKKRSIPILPLPFSKTNNKYYHPIKKNNNSIKNNKDRDNKSTQLNSENTTISKNGSKEYSSDYYNLPEVNKLTLIS